MAKIPESNQDALAPGSAENKEWPGSTVAPNMSPERGAQDRFDLSDLKAVVNPTTQPVTSGRKRLFRR